MLDSKKTKILLAMAGGAALMASTPALAAAPAGGATLTPIDMFMIATPLVKAVMIGLILASIFSWTLLIIKIFEFRGLNRKTNNFLEAFRGTRTIAEMQKVATSEEWEGNPLADMAAAATEEVELSRQAGLKVNGEHLDSVMSRAQQSVSAVQSGMSTRLSSGQQYQASTGSISPFVGLFATVFGIMNSFIGIVQSNTTNLASVAPGIAEALLATGIGLFAAIPAVVIYNYFNTRISAYGSRADGFAAELLNSISRQLDKGA